MNEYTIEGMNFMKRKTSVVVFVTLICIITNPWFVRISNGLVSENVSDILVTCNNEFGFYNGIIIGNELHFIYASDYKDKTELAHYCVENGKVLRKDIVQNKGFYLINEICLSVLVDQSFYLVYLSTQENDSTQLYDHNYYCYYFDGISNEAEKNLLINVNEYVYSDFTYANPELLGVKLLNDEAVFLLSSYKSQSNTTDIIAISLEQTTKTTQKYIVDGKLLDIASCFSNSNDCAYFLYENIQLENNYQLFEYNFTSYSLSNYANCTFSHPNYSIRSGTLVCDPLSNSKYFVCPLSYSSATDFALFEYNSSTSSFNLKSTTNNAYATFSHPNEDLRYETKPKNYDVIINNSKLSLIYRNSVPHAGITQMSLITYPIDGSEDWNYVNLDLGDNVNLFYASFLYNSTAEEYLDSYLIGIIYRDHSPYHSFGGLTNIVSSIGIYGSYATDISKPYFIRAIKTTYFWLIIASSIIVPLTLGGVFYIYIRRYKRKQKSQQLD